MHIHRTRFIFAGLILVLCGLLLFGNDSGTKRVYARPTSLDETLSEPGGSWKLPIDIDESQLHPVGRLIEENKRSWSKLLAQQSTSLEAAVKAYQTRYGIPPPPHFDAWFKFARARNVKLIDEYDTIYHDLLPFWGLKPSTIRSRVREALGVDNNAFIQVSVRGGRVKYIERGEEWQRNTTIGMMRLFVRYLPDMDLAFNIHDEPRVSVPHEDLHRLIQRAKYTSMARLAKNPAPRRKWSRRPKDVNKGESYAGMATTKFNEFAHQATWFPGTLSCPPDSPARSLDSESAEEDVYAYATEDKPAFVYNQTAFSDVCNSPSLATTHGAFERPNAFKVVHQLFPVFSQSKLSSYNDILYPSPWYWASKASYNATLDMPWADKATKLWWVGSSTGGYSRNGGWRRQHRELMVSGINALEDKADILRPASKFKPAPAWQSVQVSRSKYSDLVDVHFTNIGQCDEEPDCREMREHFNPLNGTDSQNAWKSKFLLDMDGNAFSGRFYTFLRSKSVPLKMAVFREWHAEWLRPWVHYVPLSLRGKELLEIVRYFALDKKVGASQAEEMAAAGSEWAQGALRKDDFEVWFFRLLLEYARLVDDDRDKLGFVMPGVQRVSLSVSDNDIDMSNTKEGAGRANRYDDADIDTDSTDSKVQSQ